MKFKTLLLFLHRIQQVADRIDNFQNLFDPRRYTWLNKTALLAEIAGAEEKITERGYIDQEIDYLKQRRRGAKGKLYTALRVWAYAIKIALELSDSKGLRLELIFTDQNIVKKARKMLAGYEKNQSLAEKVPEVDLKTLAHALSEAKDNFASLESEYLGKKDTFDTKTQEFLELEDKIEDLYYEMVNALEGVLHEHREELLILAPWKKRKASVPEEEIVNEIRLPYAGEMLGKSHD